MATRLIHVSDLYHPHADPDDHMDLAQVYALAKAGRVDLINVLVDHTRRPDFGPPAQVALRQLEALTGVRAELIPGADTEAFVGRPNLWRSAEPGRVRAAQAILDALAASREKTFITIVGGCLDTAIALSRDPELFRERCAGIALNAGSTVCDADVQEYNVTLGQLEYASIFRAPCPVYWCPCARSMRSMDMETWRGPHATYYRFRQSEMFERIGDGLTNYFLYMLERSADPDPIGALNRKPDPALVAKWGAEDRGMWSTGSIFAAAGLSVTASGALSEGRAADAVFEYIPIRVRCADDGTTEWTEDASSTDRFLCHIPDPARYESAMTKALFDTLATL